MTLIKVFNQVPSQNNSMVIRAEIYGSSASTVSFTDDIAICQVEFVVMAGGIVKVIEVDGKKGREFHPYKMNTTFRTCGWAFVVEQLDGLEVGDISKSIFGGQSIVGSSSSRWRADDIWKSSRTEFALGFWVSENWKENPEVEGRFEYRCEAHGDGISGMSGGKVRATHQIAKALHGRGQLSEEIRCALREFVGLGWATPPNDGAPLSVPWWFTPGYLAPVGWVENLSLEGTTGRSDDFVVKNRTYQHESGVFTAKYTGGNDYHSDFPGAVKLIPFQRIN